MSKSDTKKLLKEVQLLNQALNEASINEAVDAFMRDQAAASKAAAKAERMHVRAERTLSPHSVAGRRGWQMDARASTRTAEEATELAGTLSLSEKIRIDGSECWFEYSEQPFQMFLCGNVPASVQAFEAGGKVWQIRRIGPLCAVVDLPLYEIDRFGGVGRWAK